MVVGASGMGCAIQPGMIIRSLEDLQVFAQQPNYFKSIQERQQIHIRMQRCEHLRNDGSNTGTGQRLVGVAAHPFPLEKGVRDGGEHDMMLLSGYERPSKWSKPSSVLSSWYLLLDRPANAHVDVRDSPDHSVLGVCGGRWLRPGAAGLWMTLTDWATAYP